MQEYITESMDITEIHPLGAPSQDLVWVCGRVCCESSEGKLNSSSVLIEGCVDDSNGRRVHLDLSEIGSYSLFPGQVILVQGVNASGKSMIAKTIVEGLPRPLPLSTANELLEFHHSDRFQGGQPLRVIVAAGPFTTLQNLDYDPLNALMERVFNDRPDVLILLGPFVDSAHPLMKDGEILLQDDEGDGKHAATYEMVFLEKIIRDGLATLFNSEEEEDPIPTHIVLIPSLTDAHHEFVFPQPPFADRGLEKISTSFFQEAIGELNVPFSKDSDPRRRVHLMPNPCMFRYTRDALNLYL